MQTDSGKTIFVWIETVFGDGSTLLKKAVLDAMADEQPTLYERVVKVMQEAGI